MELGIAYAIGAAIVWGLVYTIDERILDTISPAALVFLQAIISAAVMAPIVFLRDQSLSTIFTSGRSNILLILFSVFLATAANFFIFSAIKATDASTASIIEISYPFFVVLFSFLLLRSAPSLALIIGGIFVFVGSLIIIKFAA